MATSLLRPLILCFILMTKHAQQQQQRWECVLDIQSIETSHREQKKI